MKIIVLPIILVVSTCFGIEISICNNEIREYCRNGEKIEISINVSNDELFDALKLCNDSPDQNENDYYINTCSTQRVKEVIGIIESLDWTANIKIFENSSIDTFKIVGYHIDYLYINDAVKYSSYNRIINATTNEVDFCVQKNEFIGRKTSTKTICGNNQDYLNNCFIQFKDSVFKAENNIKALKIDSIESFEIKDADKKWNACISDSLNYKKTNYEQVEYDYILISSELTVNKLMALLKVNKSVIEDSRFGNDRYIKYKIRIK